jgi:hypothetical protein
MVVRVSEQTGMPSPAEHDQRGAVKLYRAQGNAADVVVWSFHYPCPCNRIKQEPLYVF